jgi:hypothetical protein
MSLRYFVSLRSKPLNRLAPAITLPRLLQAARRDSEKAISSQPSAFGQEKSFSRILVELKAAQGLNAEC